MWHIAPSSVNIGGGLDRQGGGGDFETETFAIYYFLEIGFHFIYCKIRFLVWFLARRSQGEGIDWLAPLCPLPFHIIQYCYSSLASRISIFESKRCLYLAVHSFRFRLLFQPSSHRALSNTFFHFCASIQSLSRFS